MARRNDGNAVGGFPHVTTAHIGDVTYIVEHETGSAARETAIEKIRKLILRETESPKQRRAGRNDLTIPRE